MEFNVVLTSPYWELSGVNTFSVNLLRGLREYDIQGHILLTAPYLAPYFMGGNPMPPPPDIVINNLPVQALDTWKTRWQVLIDYLVQQAPCIYIPNYDVSYSCIAPQLPDNVAVVGIVHSDDPFHYEHVSRLGKYWNQIVAVSQSVARETLKLCPALSKRIVTIPNGVSIPKSLPQRLLDRDAPLRIVYAGRLVNYQKRVFDLPKIIETLSEWQIPVEVTIVGDGSNAEQLRSISQKLIELGAIRFLETLPNERVLEIFEQNDIFILTSEFEGMPVSLLEAMGRGCIPVVTDISSGIPELVQDGINGYKVSVGYIEKFASRLATLYKDLHLRQEMSLNAYRKISEGGYRTEDMVRNYVEVFQQVMQEAETGVYRRPQGDILPATDWLKSQLENLEYQLASMKNSKFWKLRDKWFAVKRFLSLTQEQ